MVGNEKPPEDPTPESLLCSLTLSADQATFLARRGSEFSSREMSLAATKAQESRMWLMAHIQRNGESE